MRIYIHPLLTLRSSGKHVATYSITGLQAFLTQIFIDHPSSPGIADGE